jgi:hypothetical protein
VGKADEGSGMPLVIWMEFLTPMKRGAIRDVDRIRWSTSGWETAGSDERDVNSSAWMIGGLIS